VHRPEAARLTTRGKRLLEEQSACEPPAPTADSACGAQCLANRLDAGSRSAENGLIIAAGLPGIVSVAAAVV
jgi:hypothetical protein